MFLGNDNTTSKIDLTGEQVNTPLFNYGENSFTRKNLMITANRRFNYQG